MGWQEAQNRYKNKESLTSQSVEDLVARRVLRGLGFAEKDLGALEMRLFGDKPDYDVAIWPRTLRVLQQAMKASPLARAAHSWMIEALETKETHKPILDRIEECVDPEDPVRPVFITRVAKTKVSLTYSLWTPHEMTEIMEPPYKVMQVVHGELLVVQDTQLFIQGLGFAESLKGLL